MNIRQIKYRFIGFLIFIFCFGLSTKLLLNEAKAFDWKKGLHKNDSLHKKKHKSHRHLHLLKYIKHGFKTEKQWDKFHKHDSIKKHFTPFVNHPQYKTFGWHLFSDGSAYKSYDFSMLWAISYFSYLVEPETGHYKTVHSWKTTALVDSAKKHNCKVLLSISNFEEENNKIFLRNKNAWTHLINQVKSLLALRKADGVTIDFEGIPARYSSEFTEFVTTLGHELKLENSNYLITLSVPAVDHENVYDIMGIDEYVDVYIVMAYDYYGSFSHKAGPISPLYSSKTWGDYCIHTTVKEYLDKGMSPGKLIVGLPYFGGEWQTKSNKIPANSKKFLNYVKYKRVKNKIIDLYHDDIQLDSLSLTQYYTQNNGRNDIRQYWFDDYLTLGYKYDYIVQNNLAGAGIWALGYDNAYHDELWELIARKFGKLSEFKSQQTKTHKETFGTNSKKIMQERYIQNYLKAPENYDDKIDWQYDSLHHTEETSDLIIYGLYPFWQDRKGHFIDFNFYSRIGYYSIIPDSTGEISYSFNWKHNDYKELAAQYGTKTDMVITCYGKVKASSLLSNSNAISKLIANIKELLVEFGGDGVTIDFSNVLNSKASFEKFIASLSGSLKAVNKVYTINIVLPAVQYTFKNTDLTTLNKYSDLILVNGFDYSKPGDSYSGPDAPIFQNKDRGAGPTIDETIDWYIKNGISKEKIILVLSMMGKQWITKTDNLFSKVITFNKLISPSRYRKITPAEKYQPFFDSMSMSSCNIENRDEAVFQTWFDDSLSIEKKLDWVKSKSIAGVGIWPMDFSKYEQSITDIIKEKIFKKGAKKKSGQKKEPTLIVILSLYFLMWILNLLLIFVYLLTAGLTFFICPLRFFINKYVYLFYTCGFLLFVSTFLLMYFTPQLNKYTDEAIFAFIIIVLATIIYKTIQMKKKAMFP